MKLYRGSEPRALKCAASIRGAADFSRRGCIIKRRLAYPAGVSLFLDEDIP